MDRQTNLLHLVTATHPASRRPSRLHRRQQQSHQHRNDRDHHEQFDKCEGETLCLGGLSVCSGIAVLWDFCRQQHHIQGTPFPAFSEVFAWDHSQNARIHLIEVDQFDRFERQPVSAPQVAVSLRRRSGATAKAFRTRPVELVGVEIGLSKSLPNPGFSLLATNINFIDSGRLQLKNWIGATRSKCVFSTDKVLSST
jgi:hypothetical protein